MTVYVISWDNIHEYGDIWKQHHALRHKVFRTRCAWNVPSHNGLEFDEFDTPLARYLISVGPDNRVRGAMRLIPTMETYMSMKHWPTMFNGTPPRSENVWEATRFCCDHGLSLADRRATVLELLEACMEYGLKNGISSYVAVMAIHMFPIGLKRNGCGYKRLGPAIDLEGTATGVAEVAISHSVLECIRSKMKKPTCTKPYAASKILHDLPIHTKCSGVVPVPAPLQPCSAVLA